MTTLAPVDVCQYPCVPDWQLRAVRGTLECVSPTHDGYYRRDLALVHPRGFDFHAQACAPGMALLEPVRVRAGLVLELGCGSGLLTKALAKAGHRVIATDASPAMLELARAYAPGAMVVRQLTLPDDPLPQADAVVSWATCSVT